MGLATVAGAECRDRFRLKVFPVQFAQLVLEEADPVTDVALLRQRQRFIDQCLPAAAARRTWRRSFSLPA